MNQLGDIIRNYRNRLGITQKQLAGNLCTANYISLIENGERTPSAFLLRHFNEKLGVDLFNTSQYLDCQHPIHVCETIQSFELYKSNSDYINLKKITELKKMDADFQTLPWSCEIQINEFAYTMFIEGKVVETIFDIHGYIEKTQKNSCPDRYVAQLYELLSMGYLSTGNIAKAQNNIELSNKLIANKIDLVQYRSIYITTQLTSMFISLQAGKYSLVIDHASKLLIYQKNNNLYERIHYTFYLLTVANSQLRNMESAVSSCMKVIYISLLEKKPYDIKRFLADKSFTDVLYSGLIDKNIINQFCQMYEIGL